MNGSRGRAESQLESGAWRSAVNCRGRFPPVSFVPGPVGSVRLVLRAQRQVPHVSARTKQARQHPRLLRLRVQPHAVRALDATQRWLPPVSTSQRSRAYRLTRRCASDTIRRVISIVLPSSPRWHVVQRQLHLYVLRQTRSGKRGYRGDQQCLAHSFPKDHHRSGCGSLRWIGGTSTSTLTKLPASLKIRG